MRKIKKAVTNLSKRELDTNEKRVLAKGFNYASSHSKNDVLQFIAHVEPAVEDIRELSQHEKANLRQRIASAVKCARPANNLTKEETSALKRLREDPSIVIA